ncbi:hypothetical protein V494_06846 [Pseudogymnoascus sp. VKM F-4513 (FW-928)]|nr:hypothetical protein V494_06846 [Pseudogymnoascus sp. VKM F-4513 (FW-928)]
MTVISPTITVSVACGVLALYVISRLLRGKGDRRPLPPGPKGLPVLGNINDLPKAGEPEWLHWLQHKDLYGPISSITVLGQPIVVINDPEVAFELMRDRSAIHSSRPSQVFSCEMVGWKNATAMSPNNNTWKIHRKNIAKVASTNTSVTMFDSVQEAESAHFLLNLLDFPDDLFAHIRKEAGTVILKITYGYTAESHGPDPLIDLAGLTMKGFAEAIVPGKWMVDIMPFLRYLPDGFPGTSFKSTGREMANTLRQCVDQPYAFVKQQMREKKHKTSFLSQAIEDIGTDAEMEFIHKWTALSLFTGGADTTVSSLMTFFLAMSVFPDVQKKAKEELDRVIGSQRLPVSADRDSLPYIMAVMKETHRWHPGAPMGIPHTSTAEDTCRGYRIPKGTIMFPNTWWFTHDPAVYPDPMIFRPERFLETPTHKPETDPRNFIFGFGRRICPGRYVADNAVFMTIAQVLTVFNIEKLVENGKVVEPEIKFEASTVSRPMPYRISIKPRSKVHEELIKAAEEVYPWEESDAKELENAKCKAVLPHQNTPRSSVFHKQFGLELSQQYFASFSPWGQSQHIVTTTDSVYTRHPGKIIATAGAIGVGAVQFPFWMLYYLFASRRPNPKWTYQQALGVFVVKSYLTWTAVIRLKTNLSLKPGWEGKRFAVIKPGPSDKYIGVVDLDPEVKPETIGGTWYPARPSSGSAVGKVVLHFHGGAYTIGDGRDGDAGFAAKTLIANTAATHVFAPQYRLASNPGCRFPAPLQDAITSYLYLTDELGIPAEKITISGDSAGGNLSLALLRYISDNPDAKLASPACAWLWSAWADPEGALTLGGTMKMHPNAPTDYLDEMVGMWGAQSLMPSKESGITLGHPNIKFLGNPFATPTPLLFLTGESEILYDHNVQLYEEFKAVEGNKVDLEVTPYGVHDIILAGQWVRFTKEAAQAAKVAGKFWDANE